MTIPGIELYSSSNRHRVFSNAEVRWFCDVLAEALKYGFHDPRDHQDFASGNRSRRSLGDRSIERLDQEFQPGFHLKIIVEKGPQIDPHVFRIWARRRQRSQKLLSVTLVALSWQFNQRLLVLIENEPGHHLKF